jgi:membrane-bound lytic murein transglycosylase D
MQFQRVIPLVLALQLILVGCASAPPPQEKRNVEQMLDADVGTLDQGLASRIMTETPHGKTKSQVRVEGEMQQKVWWWLHYYTVRDRDRFERNLERGENYRPLVQQILQERQLPTELYYLALIESGYVTHATSTTSAVGIWQFMRPSAERYGLKVDGKFDQRRQPILATEAAASYLIDLHQKFKSWYLAIAAYNCGQGRVARAIREAKTNDFWALAEKGYLPQETMDYIPKFLAAATIGNHLSTFGFKEVHAQRPWPAVAELSIDRHLKLAKIIRQSGLTESELMRFNPQLKLDLAHGRKKQIKIWLPIASAQHFYENKSAVAVTSRKKSRSLGI